MCVWGLRERSSNQKREEASKIVAGLLRGAKLSRQRVLTKNRLVALSSLCSGATVASASRLILISLAFLLVSAAPHLAPRSRSFLVGNLACAVSLGFPKPGSAFVFDDAVPCVLWSPGCCTPLSPVFCAARAVMTDVKVLRALALTPG